MQLVKHQNISQWAVTESEKTLVDVIYRGKSIAQMSKPEMAEVVELIGRWRYAVGLSKECASEDLVAMSLFIRDSYGYLSVAEIDHAIKLSITGKLGLDNEEVNPFNNFSFLYVGKILNSYLDYKKSIFKKIVDRREEHSQKVVLTDKPSPMQMAENMKDIVRGEYEKWKSNGEITDLFNIVYGYLEKVGKAGIPKEVGETITIEARKKAKEKNEKIHNGLISFTSGMSEESLYVMYGKNLCTQYFFSKLESIDDFLNTIIPEHFTDGNNG